MECWEKKRVNPKLRFPMSLLSYSFPIIPSFHHSTIPFSVGSCCLKPEYGFLLLALNRFEFAHLIAEMTSRAQA